MESSASRCRCWCTRRSDIHGGSPRTGRAGRPSPDPPRQRGRPPGAARTRVDVQCRFVGGDGLRDAHQAEEAARQAISIVALGLRFVVPSSAIARRGWRHRPEMQHALRTLTRLAQGLSQRLVVHSIAGMHGSSSPSDEREAGALYDCCDVMTRAAQFGGDVGGERRVVGQHEPRRRRRRNALRPCRPRPGRQRKPVRRIGPLGEPGRGAEPQAAVRAPPALQSLERVGRQCNPPPPLTEKSAASRLARQAHRRPTAVRRSATSESASSGRRNVGVMTLGAFGC